MLVEDSAGAKAAPSLVPMTQQVNTGALLVMPLCYGVIVAKLPLRQFQGTATGEQFKGCQHLLLCFKLEHWSSVLEKRGRRRR